MEEHAGPLLVGLLVVYYDRLEVPLSKAGGPWRCHRIYLELALPVRTLLARGRRGPLGSENGDQLSIRVRRGALAPRVGPYGASGVK